MTFGIFFGLILVPSMILLLGVISFFYVKSKEDLADSQKSQ